MLKSNQRVPSLKRKWSPQLTPRPLLSPVFAFGYGAVIRLRFGATSRRSTTPVPDSNRRRRLRTYPRLSLSEGESLSSSCFLRSRIKNASLGGCRKIKTLVPRCQEGVKDYNRDNRSLRALSKVIVQRTAQRERSRQGLSAYVLLGL